jgi:hypothetical protein
MALWPPLTFVRLHPQALSFAIATVAMSMFAQLPAPLLYGHLFDVSCAEFRTNVCGRTGDCLHYDNDLFRCYLFFKVFSSSNPFLKSSWSQFQKSQFGPKIFRTFLFYLLPHPFFQLFFLVHCLVYRGELITS